MNLNLNLKLKFFPHIDVWVFCFQFCIRSAFLRPPPPPLLLSLLQTHTHITHSLTPSRTPSLPPSLTHSTHTHTHTHTSTHTHIAHSPTHHSLTYTAHKHHSHRQTTHHTSLRHIHIHIHITHTHSHTHTSQAWGNVHCQGVGCTPWRPSGVPLVSLGLRRFCVAGVGQRPLPRGRMYALASLWCPLVSAFFAWQAWDKEQCWWLLRGRPGTMCTHTHTHHSLSHSLTHTHSHSHSH